MLGYFLPWQEQENSFAAVSLSPPSLILTCFILQPHSSCAEHKMLVIVFYFIFYFFTLSFDISFGV